MAEQNINANAAGFKEAVCIDAGRVYDSCSEIHRSLFTRCVFLSFCLAKEQRK